MRCLLDTHVFYWFRQSPEKIPARTFRLLTAVGTEALISPIVPWELAIKVGVGKLDSTNLLLDFERRETEAGFLMTPITIAQTIRSGLLPSHHRDPFDRLLIAQALDLRIPILSSDKTFDRYSVHRIWD
jgi:PIN domain nuclease of toxin-antitoxin system